MKTLTVSAAFSVALAGVALMLPPGAAPVVAQSAATEIAGMQTKVFSIKNMTCALCPITVRKAMEGVAGVKSVSVDFDAKTATVTFDPSATTAGEIGAASTNAGYPASIKG